MYGFPLALGDYFSFQPVVVVRIHLFLFALDGSFLCHSRFEDAPGCDVIGLFLSAFTSILSAHFYFIFVFVNFFQFDLLVVSNYFPPCNESCASLFWGFDRDKARFTAALAWATSA